MSESFVPIEDVAKHFSVSVSTVRAWVRQKHIPEDTYIKVGSSVKPIYRFRISDVESALTSSKQEVSLALHTPVGSELGELSKAEVDQIIADTNNNGFETVSELMNALDEEEEAMNNIQALESSYEYDLDEDQ
tara:strand:- start:247 stop:645 length:399 start_codon:yes stop_codon:yes gene_type:complete